MKVEFAKKIEQSLVSNSGKLFQALKDFFKKADPNCIVFKHGWLYNINFSIKKSIKKDDNDIYLTNMVALFTSIPIILLHDIGLITEAKILV